MNNLEVLIYDLQNINCDELHSICDYINCPSSEDCTYDGGNNNEMCTECKYRWLYEEFEN